MAGTDWRKAGTLAAGIGAACAAVAGVVVGLRWAARRKDDAPALTHSRPEGPVGVSGSARQSGPEAMRDPPSEWTRVDEASDESYPASDPPAVKHVD